MAEEPKNNRTLMWVLIGIILVLLIVIIVISFNRGGEGAHSIEEETIEAVAKDESFSIGSTAERDDISITLDSVSENPNYKGKDAAGDDIYMITYWTIDNRSTNTIEVEQEDFEASYNEEVIPTEESLNNFVQTELGPDESYSGTLVYEVPEDFTELTVVAAPPFWNQNAAFIFNLDDIALQDS